jgi:hypothetical protein
MTRSARRMRALGRERLGLSVRFRGEGTLQHMGITAVTAPGRPGPGRGRPATGQPALPPGPLPSAQPATRP